MYLSKQNKILLFGYFALFICGILTSTFRSFPIIALSPLCFAVISIVFMMSTGKRIANSSIRRLFLLIGGMLLLLFVLQTVKYVYLQEQKDLLRYMTYAYHAPLVVIPLLSFYTSLCIGKLHTDRPIKKWLWLLLPCAVLVLLFATNDAHRLAYALDENKTIAYNRIVCYMSWLWQGSLLMAAFVITIRKSRIRRSKSRAWIPLLFLLVSVTLFILYYLNDGDALEFANLRFQFQYIYGFMIVGFWEGCIQIGLISSNTDYEEIFNHSAVSAQITDARRNTQYQSVTARSLTQEQMRNAPTLLDDSTKLSVQPIRGGYVYYTDDISEINRLNERLRDAAELIAEGNVITEEENRIKQETALLEIQNLLYDTLSDLLAPTLTNIQTFVQAGDFAKTAILGAYIKRRANLYLLSRQAQTADIMELSLAIRESLSYLSLLGAQGVVFCDAQGELPSETLLHAYDFFEQRMERIPDGVSNIMVVLNRDCMNIAVDGDAVSFNYERTAKDDD